ncbi:IS200/IS605 family transposase [Actinopolyspora lacussalsi]|nr:IS200/IS605 family transposase [Actinopolyspora righensis]
MAETEDYRTGRHCVFGMHVHLVFVTKYRRNVLTNQHHDFLREVFAKVCADFGATLSECNGEDDHVHLLVEYPPQMAVSKLVNSLKGVASRRLKQHFRMRTYRGHLWSPSYFAASCGGAPLSIIQQYVENQRRPS